MPEAPRARSRAPRLNRKLHRWGALVSALPVLVVVLSGLLLQLKKDWAWVQPPTRSGTAEAPSLPFEAILAAAAAVPEAEVSSWEDIDRLDVRPDKGVVKVRCENRWELQLDAATGEVLSSTLRRSDLIESIHDGSWFSDGVKLWVFLPAALVLTGLWFTGVYLWWLPFGVRRRRRRTA